MRAVTTALIGRFGNQLFQYAHARAYAEQHGCLLVTPKWIGQEIFTIDDPLPQTANTDELRGYCQDQSSLIYTRAQVKQWFTFRPHIEKQLQQTCPDRDAVVCHRRTGDYLSCGYVVVSEKSYWDLISKLSLPEPRVFLSEESSQDVGFKPQWLPDFYRMVHSRFLLRGNSSFSWWAATLADCDCEVFSPIIEGLEGGREHDVKFAEGNWPRLANLEFVTDLHLAP